MTNISKKTKWVSTGGWSGYQAFINAVAGANDTGTWDDSPCPTPTRKREVGLAKTALRKAGIKHVTAWARTSNCFSMSQQILVGPADRQRAIEILSPLHAETCLLWVEKN